MTIEQYREKYRGEFKAHEGQPWFVALIQTLKDEHPMKAILKRRAGDRIAGSVAFLHEIKGYEDALENIDDISAEEFIPPQESEAKYLEESI